MADPTSISTAHPSAAVEQKPGAGADPADALASLKKMSTTAGVGAQDYVAVNALAVAAAILGLASILIPLTDALFLLVVPLAGVICGFVAWRQVRNSNGTQTGGVVALLGVALSICIGGGHLAYKGYQHWTIRPDQQAVASLIDRLGQRLAAHEYDGAYQLFSQNFRGRVSPERFAVVWRQVEEELRAGKVKSMQWNGTRIEFTKDASGARLAWAMAVFQFDQPLEKPPRQDMLFIQQNGAWTIDDLPGLFPREKKKQAAPNSPMGP